MIGGGPAGSVAAYMLARAGWRVRMVHADDVLSEVRPIGETLPGIVSHLLDGLRLGAVLAEGPHMPSPGTTSVWGRGIPDYVDSIRDPYGHGWRLDRAAFDRSLREEAKEAGVELIDGWVQNVVRYEDGTMEVALTDGNRLSAPCIVDATGRRATVARRCGAFRIRDVGLIALYRWGESSGEDGRTLIEACEDGWWYTALLPERQRVVVYHATTQDAPAVLRTPGIWEERLAKTRYMSWAVSDTQDLTPLQATEASGARLDRFSGPGWVAVGDAALSFDPISGQGIYNALYSGMKAGQAIASELRTGPGAIVEYGNRMEEIRSAYERHWQAVYRSEERWIDRPFWAERREA